MIFNLNTNVVGTSFFILLALFAFSLIIYKRKVLYQIFTWKNLIRGISVAICAMLIRIMIKYVGNIDILTCFLEYPLEIKYYLYAFTYFITNYFIGLTLGEFIDVLLISLVKESTTHFLGIPLGINKLKFPLGGPTEYKSTNNVKESTSLFSSREPSSPRESISSDSTSNSPNRHRSLSPFSRPATPAPFSRTGSPVPPFGPNDRDPSLEPNNLPNTPMNPSEIYPEYFRQHSDFTMVFRALDQVIQNIWKNTYKIIGVYRHGSNTNTLHLAPFDTGGVEGFMFPPRTNHPFHAWNQITTMDQCTELHLRCIIARLEHAKELLAPNNGGEYYINDQTNFPKGHERVTINQAIDRLLTDANNSLNAKRISRIN